MMMMMMKSSVMSLSPLLMTASLLHLAALLPSAAVGAAAMDFPAMEENCILSFVVPRDKVKSSCDIEDRITRRLNAMETKVTLYKQHVHELQEQLSKERAVHSQRLDEVTQLVLGDRDGRGNRQDQIAKRVLSLEDEVRKLRATFAASTTTSGHSSEKLSGRGLGLGVGLGGGVVLEQQHSRQGEALDDNNNKATTNLVKSVVRSEVKKLFDDYTQYVGRYVRDQALAFNQVINMVPRNDQSFPRSSNNNNIPPKWPDLRAGGGTAGFGLDRNSPLPGTTQPVMDRDMVLLKELDVIKSRLNATGKRLADRMEKVIKNIHVNVSSKAPPEATAVPAAAAFPPDADLDGTILEVNDTSASGDAATTSDHNNNNITFNFNNDDTTAPTHVNNNNTELESPNAIIRVASGDDSLASAAAAAAKDPTFSAKSRMNYNAEINNRLPEEQGATASDDDDDNIIGRERSSSSQEEEGPADGRSGDTARWIQALLRTEMQQVLQQQVEEVLSLVSKHSATVDSHLSHQQRKFDQLEERLTADIKHLDQVVSGLKLELTSVSQGLQTAYSRTENMAELEETVLELKKNASSEGTPRILATLLDEQTKKVRKIERLTDIYKQSLEHYRNETKLEYRDLRERLTKENAVLRALNTDLFHNVTEHARQLNDRLNKTASKQHEEVKQRVQVIDDNNLLLQIDLSSLERQLKSKTSKAERDVERLSDDVGSLKHKARDLQSALNGVVKDQRKLDRTANRTLSEVQQLQMEVKLNVLDDWLPYDFDYMKTRTDCFGQQYVRRSGFKNGRIVGVVLCSKWRYKIFLAQSLTDTFKNVGDDSGMGEDHCQFVNARSMSKVKVSPFRNTADTEPGFVRTHWGQEPRPDLLNMIRPSPAWYECGVSIP